MQGAAVGYDNNGPLRAELALTDGLRSANTNFQDFPASGIQADWGVAGRVDWKLMGDWKQYNSFSAQGSKDALLVLGAGVDYTEAGDTRQLSHVIDIQYDAPCGLSAYAAYLGRYVENNGGLPGSNGGAVGNVTTHDTYDATVRAQIGYVTASHWEPFARYEFIHFDPDGLAAGTKNHDVHEFTAGLNYYLHGQRAKFTMDVSYLPEGSPVADDSSGVLVNDGSDEFVFRAQFQLIL